MCLFTAAVKTLLASTLLFVVVGAARPAAQDQLSSARYLVGTWTCSYQTGATRVQYQSTFSYEMGGNWLRERDKWAHGGSDEALFTYDPKKREWTFTIFENSRTTTVFVGHGTAGHVLYKSVYPNSNATEALDEISPSRYTLRFTAYANGKANVFSTDICTKDPG